ncbi:hypothetical protein VB712_08430 [Spirulina sp. CCNP1310]|uniref:hypothetical protein n=1 Tax=Spirulina sp. CCNP1310 TaxID=3110249 RepID=UPI002B1F7C54|nr:hypothetical protein [Spirulina sp. CCNP1310]MEA5419253.1 hypothetical protein [Spirulina sp. CCNP1310]
MVITVKHGDSGDIIDLSDDCEIRDDKYGGCFYIPESQVTRLEEWILAMDTQIATQQLKTGRGMDGRKLDAVEINAIDQSLEAGKPLPDYGVNGGGYRYSFSPNTMGTVVVVENVISGDQIDVSDYEDW